MLAIVAAAAAETKSGLPQLHAPDFGPQLFWLAISFLVLYAALSRFALPRIGEVLGARRDRIQSDLDAAGQRKAEADAALGAYRQTLAEAKAKAQAMAREVRDRVAAETERERAEAEALAAARLAEAETRIAAAKAQALAGVNEIAAETAGAIVTQILGENTSAEEVRQAMTRAAAE